MNPNIISIFIIGFLPIFGVVDGFIIVIIDGIFTVIGFLFPWAEAQHCPHLENVGQ